MRLHPFSIATDKPMKKPRNSFREERLFLFSPVLTETQLCLQEGQRTNLTSLLLPLIPIRHPKTEPEGLPESIYSYSKK